MEIITDIVATEKTVNRLLKRIEKQPIEIYPGYNSGLTLPPDAHVNIFAPTSQILPLCKFDDQIDLFVSFMVYPKGSFTPMFEMSFKKSGRYLNKNNKKFENPPYFDKLFNAVRNIYKKNLADLIQNDIKKATADMFFYRCQTKILKYLMVEKDRK